MTAERETGRQLPWICCAFPNRMEAQNHSSTPHTNAQSQAYHLTSLRAGLLRAAYRPASGSQPQHGVSYGGAPPLCRKGLQALATLEVLLYQRQHFLRRTFPLSDSRARVVRFGAQVLTFHGLPERCTSSATYPEVAGSGTTAAALPRFVYESDAHREDVVLHALQPGALRDTVGRLPYPWSPPGNGSTGPQCSMTPTIGRSSQTCNSGPVPSPGWSSTPIS